ncbi:MAG: hypothetical protein HPY58_11160 [Firmicutes bacterium]|nr:hypothetical protein [Bacillota bacterium]
MEKWIWLIALGALFLLMFWRGGCCGHMGSSRRNKETSAAEGDAPGRNEENPRSHDSLRSRGGSCH